MRKYFIVNSKFIVFAFCFISFCTNISYSQDYCFEQLPAGQCWDYTDMIKTGEIDQYAQAALGRMFAYGGNMAAEASAMLCAVKRRHLLGIYKADTRKALDRHRATGGKYWMEIIPEKGKKSKCYNTAPGKPMLVFRPSIKDNKDVLAGALSEAWKHCGIKPSAIERCYAFNPNPPPKTEAQCTTIDDCKEKFGDAAVWKCVVGWCIGFPPDIPDPKKPKNQKTACAKVWERLDKDVAECQYADPWELLKKCYDGKVKCSRYFTKVLPTSEEFKECLKVWDCETNVQRHAELQVENCIRRAKERAYKEGCKVLDF